MPVPVFDSSKHLSGNSKFKPEEVLTQRLRVDPLWHDEIPYGSFVAVHSTVTVYENKKIKSNSISFNLLAVQILALPLTSDD